VEEEDWNIEDVGLFINGVYNRSEGSVVELVNFGNPFEAGLYIDGEPLSFEDYQRTLNLKEGILERVVSNKKVKVVTTRFASIEDRNLLYWKIEVEAKDRVNLELLSCINTQSKGYDHLISQYSDENSLILKTKESGIEIVFLLEHRKDGWQKENPIVEDRKIGKKIYTELQPGNKVFLEKFIRISDSRIDGPQPLERLRKKTWDENFKEKHIAKWGNLWNKADVKIYGDDLAQRNLRYAIFQLLQMAPWHSDKVSIPAKALSGEAYKGHIFWDNEIFVFPFFLYTFPEVAKNLLLYRYYCLEDYRKKAREDGYEGASIAWESADTGEEETPKWGRDAKTGKPVRILTGEQEVHITGDVMWAIWQYYLATSDKSFLLDYGIEMFLETARYWSSRVKYNPLRDSYEILEVIGPDEFHEGVKNNYYTNYLAKWNLLKTIELIEWIEREDSEKAQQLKRKINFREDEKEDWREKAEKIYLLYQGIFIEQFEGFNQLEEVNLEEIKKSGRPVDAILGHSGVLKSKVIKQADVIVLFFLFEEDFHYEKRLINFKYYEPLTSHSSSLSPSIHSIVGARLDLTDLAYDYFLKTSEMDLSDVMGNTRHGLHAASIGGTWNSVFFGFLGVKALETGLRIDPKLPSHWNKVEITLSYKGNRLRLETENKLKGA